MTSFLAHTPSRIGFKPREEFNWRKTAKNQWGGLQIDDFPTHVTFAPFKWNYYEMEFDMAFVAGVFGVEHENGLLEPKLGYGVMENTLANRKN